MSSLGDESECSICQDVLTNPVTTKCGHTFCGTCESQWINTCKDNQLVPTCAVCRRVYKHKCDKTREYKRKLLLAIYTMLQQTNPTMFVTIPSYGYDVNYDHCSIDLHTLADCLNRYSFHYYYRGHLLCLRTSATRVHRQNELDHITKQLEELEKE